MKVNEQFLFGCSTGVWGRGWGERKGIMELHAYSVMRAVEMDGERLLLLKNPWGKGEWNGAWSDGSKEWTPEWLKKLNHRFGDDGAFWISYEDLLRKYQAFDRTRLFGPDWKVASIWTTLMVPWTLEYHDTKFAFTLTKPGPVVLVLSQLDDRYFRGLEGQYRFELSFRLHLAGEEDYVVRSQTTYRMIRSVNVELELEAGEYHVLVKIDATRDDTVMPAEDVVRAHAKEKREKLIRIGLAYDVAHSKGKIIESAEEKAGREGYERWKRDKEKKELKERIVKDRARTHYIQVKRLAKNRKAMEKRRAKQKARDEKAQAEGEKRGQEKEKLMGERHPFPPDMGMGRSVDVPAEPPGRTKDGKDKKQPNIDESKRKADAQALTGERRRLNGSSKEAEMSDEAGDGKVPQAADKAGSDKPKEESVKDGDSSVGHSEDTPTSTISEKSVGNDVKAPTETSSTAETQPQTMAPRSATMDGSANVDRAQVADYSPRKQPEPQPEPSTAEPGRATMPPEQDTDPGQENTEPANLLKPGDLSQEEETFHSANQDPGSSAAPSTYASESEIDADRMLNRHNYRPMGSNNNLPRGPDRHPPSHCPGPPAMPPPCFRPQGYQRHHPLPNFVTRGGRMGMGMGPPPPPTPRGFVSDNESLSSISSPSDISDRELEYHLEDQKSRNARVPPPPAPGRRVVSDSEDDEFERDPWNAVAVVGFRVYYKVGEDEGKGGGEGEGKLSEENVSIRVIRPVWFPADQDGKEPAEKVMREGKVRETGMDESMVLDLDDSAKDATLTGGEKALIQEGIEETEGKTDGGEN